MRDWTAKEWASLLVFGVCPTLMVAGGVVILMLRACAP